MYIGLNNLGLNYVTKAFSPASVFNVDSTGLWVEAYNPDSLLQRRNLFSYSEDLTNAVWSSSTTVEESPVAGPNGHAAWRLTPAANDQAINQLCATTEILGITTTFSAKVRADTPHVATLRVHEGAAASQSEHLDINVTTDWQLFELPVTWTVTGNSIRAYIYPKEYGTGAANLSVDVADIQIEYGATATTYQKVTDWYTEYLAAADGQISMYQTETGVTPITAINQADGLWLSKTGALQRGAELFTLDFTTASVSGDVTATTTNSFTTGATGGGPFYAALLTVGKAYELVVEGTTTATSMVIRNTNGLNSSISSSGTFAIHAHVLWQENGNFWLHNTDGGTTTITSISVKEITGIPMFQGTSGSRPMLSARVNLLTKTEQFDDAVWVTDLGGASTLTKQPNTVVAPDGTTTACRLFGSSVSGAEYAMFRHNSGPEVADKVRSWYIKNNTGVAYSMTLGDTQIDLPADDGWHRYSVSESINAWGTRLMFNVEAGAYDIAVWHPDTRTANDAALNLPTYQRVNTDTDYDTDGFPNILQFDGADDSIETGAFSAGTLSADMDCFMLIRRYDDSRSLLGTDSSFDHYFACFDSGVTDVADSLVGAPDYYVNGTVVPKSGGQTYRDTLAAALPVGEWVVLEIRNLDLSAFLSFEFSSYGATWYFSGDLAALIVCQAQADSVRTQIRRYLGNKVGLSL
jgi:hypothetical protein